MKNTPTPRATITIAQQGQIIQRVLVDGWTSAQAAAAFGVPKRLVDVWVADFRKDGMASLRQKPGQTIAAEVVHLMLSRSVRAIWRKISIGLRRLFLASQPAVQPLPLRRTNKDGPR